MISVISLILSDSRILFNENLLGISEKSRKLKITVTFHFLSVDFH